MEALVLLLVGCLTVAAQESLNLEDVSARFDELLAITEAAERRRAIYETANRWAEEDPISAFTAISARPPGAVRDEIEGALITSWMAVDTRSALRFVAALEEPPAYLLAASRARGNVRGFLPIRPNSDLAEIFEIADELPNELGRFVRLESVRRMARSDPRTAAELVRRLPSEEQRQAGVSAARHYAAVDSEGALAWARELGEPDVERVVVQAMAAQDPYGMLARALSGAEGIDLSLVASSALHAPGLDRAHFGSALARSPRTSVSARALSTFTQSWLVTDQEAALEWIVDSGSDLPPEAIRRAADRSGNDAEFAAAYAQRLQGQARSEWIENVGSRYGRQDPEGALAWIEQFRADPAYVKVVANIAPQLALIDGPRAARLIEALDGREWLGATWTVARQWAKHDPTAAMRWADGLPDSARGPSIHAAADEWHSYDAERAERWIVGLPRSPLREDALLGLVAAVARNHQIPSERLFDTFTTEAARQAAVLSAIAFLLLDNQAGARELFERRLTDPDLRRRAEALLDPPPLEPGEGGGFYLGPGPTSR